MSEKTGVTNIGVEELLEDYLSKYGDKGKLVLLAAVEAMRDLERRGEYSRLGDFDYRTLKEALEGLGGGVSPSIYLRALERDYGLIAQTYRSTRQQWWSFTDRVAVLKWYERVSGRSADEPEMKAILAKYRALKPEGALARLESMLHKRSLSPMEQKELKEFIFSDLDKFLAVLSEMKKHGEVFEREAGILSRVIDLAYRLASRL